MAKPEDTFKNLLDLFANPLFQAGFAEFSAKAQQEGLDMAKRFWGVSDYAKAFPDSAEFYERLAEWYKAMGFVPAAKYQELEAENAKLKEENQALKNLLKDMQLNFFSQAGEQARQDWRDIIDRQMQTNAELANSFFEAIRQYKAGS